MSYTSQVHDTHSHREQLNLVLQPDNTDSNVKCRRSSDTGRLYKESTTR